MTIKHSFLPPSGAHAWSKCALWPTMNARYPQEDSAESMEGTAAHWVAGSMLSGVTPEEGSLSPNGIAVTQEMIEGGQMVVDKLHNEEGFNFHVEETISIPAIHEDCFGTPDFWTYDEPGETLYIIDYKFGHRFVDEYWNLQGLLYMAGIIGQLPTIPNSVDFTIIQPRCYYGGNPVRTHSYYINHATNYLVKLRKAAELALVSQPTATTGSQCEHCPGRHSCPTLQKAAYSDAETSTDQQPVELSPQAAALELRMLERALLRLNARVDGLKELTTANLKAGRQVPHYKLEAGRGRTAWKISDEEVIKKLGKKKATVTKVITPTQAKKLLLDDSIISRYTHYVDGGLKLVESDDTAATRIFKKET